MCAHLTITGRCTTGPGEVVISADTATRYDYQVGDVIEVTPAFGKGQNLTVVGTYNYLDPTGQYWAGTRYIGERGGGTASSDAIFLTVATFGGIALQQITVTDDVRVPDEVFRGTSGAHLADQVRSAS